MRATVIATLLLLSAAAGAAEPDRAKWDRRYGEAGYRYGDEPAATLESWQRLLQAKAENGRAVDVACGEAQNGVFLATLGFRVDAIDISQVGLDKAKRLAARRGVEDRLNAIRADLETYNLKPNTYDVIVNFRFLLRRLAPQMIAALKPGGVLIFESFTVDDPPAKKKGANTAHFLERNELLRLFSALHVVHYQERLRDGRVVATLVAVKSAGDAWLELTGSSGAP